jgi:predicted SprT family Zn-dependent metalloprotease
LHHQNQSIMQLTEAKNLAIQLMNQHGLLEQNWHFQFDNAKRRFGVCNHRLKRIGLSKHLVSLNDEARVTNTILHEIAHALVGGGHGHDNVWRRKAIEIGCDGQRCYSTKVVEQPESRYIATCNGCGKVFKRHKMTKSISSGNRKQSCGSCSNGYYNELYRLNWVLNPNI